MKVLEKLENILEEEKKCLLSGDYARLEDLAEAKIFLAKKMSTTSFDCSRNKMDLFRRKVQHNEDLLDSARRGIKSAMSHLKESTERSFQSYSKEGDRRPLSKQVTLQQKV